MGLPALDRLCTVPWDALAGLDAVTPIARLLGGQAAEGVTAGVAAERVVDRTLRDQPWLTAHQRAALVEAIFGVALWRRRIAALLGMPGRATPAQLLFGLLRDLAGVDEARAAQLSGTSGPRRQPEPTRLADRYSFPDWIAQVLEEDAAPEALAGALCSPGPIFLRANTLRVSREELARLLAQHGIQTEPCVYARAGLRVVTQRPNLLALEPFRAGFFEVQDEGSQLLSELLEPRPGETVLDLCAGAGGKTLHLAALLEDRGRLLASDPDAQRLARLRKRAARAGASCVELVPEPRGHSLEADRVLVDAPCSELGTLRRGPDARWRLREEEAAQLPALQLAILQRALAQVAPGGRLVYATCTLRREENRGAALAFERAHPRLRRLVPCALPSADGFFECFPHRHGTDGFFAAVWQC